MTVDDSPPGDGQVRVNLAMQVAGIAAQVSSALRSGNADQRQELESKLNLARAQLECGPAPEGLAPFIDAMCALLRGEDPMLLAADLPIAYRAVYDQLVGEMQRREDEGDLTVRQVLDEVSSNVVAAMKQGTYAQRRMMANTLLKMQQESAWRPDLRPLVGFLEAARALLQDEDWASPASELWGTFQARWEDVLYALRDSATPNAS